MMASRKVMSAVEAAKIMKRNVARRRQRPLTVAVGHVQAAPNTPTPKRKSDESSDAVETLAAEFDRDVEFVHHEPTVRKHPVNPRVVVDSALSRIQGFAIRVLWHGTGVALLDSQQMVTALANLAVIARDHVSGDNRRVAFELRNDSKGLTIRLAHQGCDKEPAFSGAAFAESVSIIEAHGGTLNVSARHDGGHDILIRIPRGPNGTGPNR